MSSNPNKKLTAGLSLQFGLLMTVILIISMVLTSWLSYLDTRRINETTLNTRIESIGHLMVDISIEPELLQDAEQLADYLILTLNNALKKAGEIHDAELSAVAREGMPNIPGMDQFLK